MSVTYRPAPAVEHIAGTLIPTHHPDLDGVRIQYVFRSKASKKNDKIVLGKARKVSGLNAYLATPADEVGFDDEAVEFFVIEIAEDCWRDLNHEQRIALVDHELCHLAIEFDDDEQVKLVMRSHDLEEFREIVERHGLWKPDLTEFADSVAKAVQAQFEGLES